MPGKWKSWSISSTFLDMVMCYLSTTTPPTPPPSLVTLPYPNPHPHPTPPTPNKIHPPATRSLRNPYIGLLGSCGF